MPNDPDDPRTFFAAERTLLAWLRTGLAIMGLGFVVARFGLFLSEISQATTRPYHHVGSTVIGVAVMVFGAAGIGIATWQHIRFCRRLTEKDLPRDYWLSLSLWYGFALAAVGVILAGYLVWQIVYSG